MSDGAWPSTKALSVFNALSNAQKNMTETQVLEYLRSVWDPDMVPEYVAQGAEYLVEKKFAMRVGPELRIKRGPNGKGQLVVRDGEDLKMLSHWSP